MNTERFHINVPKIDKPRVVVIGGGFAGINFIKELKDGPFQVVLLDRHNYHTFQPMLYQVATSGLEADSISEPFRRIFNSYEDFHFRMLKVISIDAKNNEVKTLIGNLKYDYLVIACGTKPNFFGNENIAKHAIPLKSVSNALDLRSKFWQCLEKANMTKSDIHKRATLTFTIVGGGPTGVEVAGALAEMRDHILTKDFPDLDMELIRICIVDSNPKVLKAMSQKSSEDTKRYLEKLNVELLLNNRVEDYDGRTVALESGGTITSETLIWAAGVTANTINGLGENAIEKGRYLVNDQLRLENQINIFAVGDVAFLKTKDYEKGHPCVAQVAIQQGKHLGKNLMAIHHGKVSRPFSYTDKGTMATIGRNKAVVDFPNRLHLKGFFAWIIWGLVHIYYLIGFRNKAIAFYNWAESYMTYDRGTRLIIKPYVPMGEKDAAKFIKQNEIGI